jgi:hypothetical protein
MDENEEVKHVIVEGSGDPPAASPEAITDTAAVAVATAGAAAALANETAAHAELQAAEEVAEVEAEADEWRIVASSQLQELGTSLASLSDRLSAIGSRAEENSNAQTVLLERLLRLEEAEASRLSNPETSEETSEAPTAEERTENAPIVGTEVAANLGPAEASAEAGLTSSSPSPEATAPAGPSASRARKRWI